ncbi:ABC transporter permease [Streptomyces sp. NPDC051994]|uniref:ABC transporter permease n=1 Tax=unclassified Streptomyces TaxID=2593676 RepID=UPI0034345FD8
MPPVPPQVVRTEVELKVEADGTLGVVAWTVAGTGVFGMGITVVSWRRRRLLRRIRLAPVSVPAVLLSLLAANLLVTLAQTAAFLAVVLLPVFGVRPGVRWWLGLPVVLLGARVLGARSAGGSRLRQRGGGLGPRELPRHADGSAVGDVLRP